MPAVRARLYTVTLYTTTRAAQVRVLACEHVDVTYSTIKVLMSDDAEGDGGDERHEVDEERQGSPRHPRAGARAEPGRHMVTELRGVGRLFPDRPRSSPKRTRGVRRPSSTLLAAMALAASPGCGTFKRDLRAALTWGGSPVRPELFDGSDRRASILIRFHDLRASGITWRHARRDNNPAAILQECGHEDQATNEIYIRALRGLAPADLFAALPARLGGPVHRVNQTPPKAGQNSGRRGT